MAAAHQAEVCIGTASSQQEVFGARSGSAQNGAGQTQASSFAGGEEEMALSR